MKQRSVGEDAIKALARPRGVTLPAFTIGTGRLRRFTTHHPEQADQQLAANLKASHQRSLQADERNDRDRSIIRPLVRRRRGSGV